MSVTLTTNYKEIYKIETVEKIDDLLDENYSLDDMIEFIDTRNEDDFISFYEEYVRCGEEIGYGAVDALIEEMGCVSDIQDCDQRYRGCYESVADFAEDYVTDCYADIPDVVVVDWENTWESNLRYDFTACEVGYREVHIFSDF